MKLGNIDLGNFEYLIIYSEPDNLGVVNTWTLPEGNFQFNFERMVKRGCIIYNVYRRMSQDDLIKQLKSNGV